MPRETGFCSWRACGSTAARSPPDRRKPWPRPSTMRYVCNYIASICSLSLSLSIPPPPVVLSRARAPSQLFLSRSTPPACGPLSCCVFSAPPPFSLSRTFTLCIFVFLVWVSQLFVDVLGCSQNGEDTMKKNISYKSSSVDCFPPPPLDQVHQRYFEMLLSSALTAPLLLSVLH